MIFQKVFQTFEIDPLKGEKSSNGAFDFVLMNLITQDVPKIL